MDVLKQEAKLGFVLGFFIGENKNEIKLHFCSVRKVCT